MSKEQEDAAKWQMYEKYKQQRALAAVLDRKLRDWGELMSQLGGNLNPKADRIAFQHDMLENLPTKEEVEAAYSEWLAADNLVHTLKKSLKDAGMTDLQ